MISGRYFRETKIIYTHIYIHICIHVMKMKEYKLMWHKIKMKKKKEETNYTYD